MHMNPAPSASVVPISGMPASHPAVTNTVCGEQLTAGQPIPAVGQWSQSGRSTTGGDCKAVPSGTLFYGYNWPKGMSGNVGYEIPDAISFYMVMDNSSSVYLVVAIDAPGNSNPDNGKSLKAELTSTGLVGLATDPSLVIRDDPGERDSMRDGIALMQAALHVSMHTRAQALLRLALIAPYAASSIRR